MLNLLGKKSTVSDILYAIVQEFMFCVTQYSMAGPTYYPGSPCGAQEALSLGLNTPASILSAYVWAPPSGTNGLDGAGFCRARIKSCVE